MTRVLNAWWIWFLTGSCVGGATAGLLGVPPGPATIIVAKLVAVVFLGGWWLRRERSLKREGNAVWRDYDEKYDTWMQRHGQPDERVRRS